IESVGAEDGWQVRVQIGTPEGIQLQSAIPIRANSAEALQKIDPVHLWSPNEPNLYHVKLRLCRPDGFCVDYVQTYFGMRKVATVPSEDGNQPESLCLNNVARYHRGVLHQAYYPEGVYTPRDIERFKNDIAFAKQAGFNFLRIHIKIEDPLMLHYADTMGMLLMCDFPNFGEGGDTVVGRRRYEGMMRGTID